MKIRVDAKSFPNGNVAGNFRNRLRRFVGAIRRPFSLGPTPENALAAGLDRVFMA